MNQMKTRESRLVLLAVLILILFGCGDGDDKDDSGGLDSPVDDDNLDDVGISVQAIPAECRWDVGGVRWAKVSAGSFLQGSPENEFGRNENEFQHEATLTRDFEIMVSEVSQGLFEQMLGNNPSYNHKCGAHCPVDRVSWHDAIAFSIALSRSEGSKPCFTMTNIYCEDGQPGDETDFCAGQGTIRRADIALNDAATVYECEGYRLPTEAEWEYAARAGTETAYYSGNVTHLDCDPVDPSLNRIGWYCGNTYLRGRHAWESRPVCLKEPNALGIYDMSGNVWEWVWDRLGPYDVGPIVDPTGPEEGEHRVMRGGSWRFDALRARSAYRGRHFSGATPRVTGFRLARTIGESKVEIKSTGKSHEIIAPPAKPKAASPQRLTDTNEAFVEGGLCKIGCERNDIDCYGDEFPLHEAYLEPFYMDIYEVTNQEYADYLNDENTANECMGDTCAYTGHPQYRGLYESGGQWLVDADYEDRPVGNVTWHGALTYCMSKGKRLPTGAEFEKAAKGGVEHYIFTWGDEYFPNASNGADSGDPYEGGGNPPTTPVGYFDGSDHGGTYQTVDGRSPYGIHDLLGNVWEWVSDYYGTFYYLEEPEGGWINPPGIEHGSTRGLRGACYADREKNLRAAGWHMDEPETYIIGFGFRCARSE
jgi:formylglycine-generating enzyme required for sulfatase activity